MKEGTFKQCKPSMPKGNSDSASRSVNTSNSSKHTAKEDGWKDRKYTPPTKQ